MYSELREALRWHRAMPEAGDLRRNLERNAARRFDKFVGDSERISDTERVRIGGATAVLSDVARLACLSSPQGIFASSRMCVPQEGLAYFEGAFAVAALEAGLMPTYQGNEVWSARGDKSYQIATDGSRTWKRSYIAPVIEGYLPVDMRSPATQSVLPGIDSKTEPVAVYEEGQLFALLLQAHSLIEPGAPFARRFIEEFARVVVVQNSATDAGFQSAGARITAGRMVMINPLAAIARPELITDGLIHESIHCAIDHCEFVEPILLVVQTDATIVSPWTGKRLDLSTFIHACFVWYGLVHFWTLANTRCAKPTVGAIEMLATARRGFLAVHPIALLAPFHNLLNPEVVKAVGEMQVPE